jgi:hypothetical protein
MRTKRKSVEKHEYRRYSPRVHSLRDISLTYEGGNEKITVRPPDISTQGMFINTSRIFPEGSILSVQFRLAISGMEVQTRCEVRYCLPGVGVGVEFIGISPQAARTIEQEVALNEEAGSMQTRSRRVSKRTGKVKQKRSH